MRLYMDPELGYKPTDPEPETILELREDGLTWATIAQRFGLSEGKAKRLVERAMLPLMPEPKPIPPKPAVPEKSRTETRTSPRDHYTAKVVELVREGKSYSEAMDIVLEQEAS